MAILTKTHKEKITEQAVERGVATLTAQCAKDWTDFAETVYAFSTDLPKEAEFRALPHARNWATFTKSAEIDLKQYSNKKVKLKAERPLAAHNHYNGYHLLRITDHKDFTETFLKLGKQDAALRTLASEAKTKVVALLATVNTFEQFRKAWPEGVELLPEEPKKNYALVPVGLVADLNKMVGVPSGKVAK